MTKRKNRAVVIVFTVAFIAIVSIFVLSLIKTKEYNKKSHQASFAGDNLFTVEDNREEDLAVRAEPRSSTWTKLIDYYNEGISEDNYQAFTYDFYLTNNTKDEVESFTYKLTFDRETYLLSAWNGSLEIHQKKGDGEYVATVPDLREFDAGKYALDTYKVEGDDMVRMKKGDYLIYYPNTTENAMEIPIPPHQGVVTGIILNVPIGEDISGATIEIEYTLHRWLQYEPLFWISVIGLGIWILALIVMAIIEVKTRKYIVQHEHDNEMLKESIETFTGFIDAKDPYTNGHSNRVAKYTRMIAKEMGYSGEELDRVYYIALLHDCGKIGVPDSILGKPGKLTDEEFQIIKSHTTHGGDILNHFKSLEKVGDGARFHHERYDGKGYPEGKKGEEIPLIARMICVADSFDAMNSNRVYRKKLSKDEIIDEIERNKGTQFDPKIADIFLRLIREGKIEIE